MKNKQSQTKANPDTHSQVFELNAKLLILLSAIIITIYYLIFEKFFPTVHGRLGQDYIYLLPQFLDGTIWFKTNGLFEVPWFTPSFGGGLPNFPNPQSMYYSVPQFLCFVFNPILSIKLTFIIFGILGFYGFYILLRRLFLTSSLTAFLGATLFLFNGFYSHRSLVGHLTYHSFMLFPLFLYFIFRSSNSQSKFILYKTIRDIAAGGLMIAYMFYSGALSIIPPLLLIVAIIFIFNILINGKINYLHFLIKICFIFILAGALAASKLNASYSFLSLFPRNLYPLPGIESIIDILKLCFNVLFGNVDIESVNEITVNKLFYLEQHEYEFGITIVPLILFISGIALYFYHSFVNENFYKLNLRQSVAVCILLFLLSIPMMLNYYSPKWNELIKMLPFIKNSSTNIRWFCIYIPTLILFACLIMEKDYLMRRYRLTIVISGIVIILLTNFSKDRKYYANQFYIPTTIMNSYNDLKSGKFKPMINNIDTISIINNSRIIYSNDVLAGGTSQFNPYEPIFGYNLENFPRRSLKIGAAMQVDSNGLLNLKNPSSYVFPVENNCAPGSEFTVGQKEDAEKFRRYLPFPFSTPFIQKVSNYATILSLLSVIAYLSFFLFLVINNRESSKTI